MAGPKGFMLVTMEPPAALEEEFNDWYDNEHIPERLEVPGFLSAVRFVCTDGWPKYLALYDLESYDVFQSKEYAAIGGKNLSPWSQRVLKLVRGQFRVAGDLVYPADGGITGTAARLVMFRFSGVAQTQESFLIEGLRSNFELQPETSQIRLFRSRDSERPYHIGLVEARAPYASSKIELAGFGECASKIELVNTYSPYWKVGGFPRPPQK